MKLRIKFPLGLGNDPKDYFPQNVFLKVSNNHTEAYADLELTHLLPQAAREISLDVEVPDNLERIEVVRPVGMQPVASLALTWLYGYCSIPGLKKCLAITNIKTYEIPVRDNIPDFKNWPILSNCSSESFALNSSLWILSVYITDSQTFAILNWYPNLIQEQLTSSLPK